MGTYIYRAYSKAITIKNLPVKANLFSFLCRGYEPNRLTDRCDRAWERKGALPKYVVLCDAEDGPQVGDSVYKWTSEERAWDYDTPNFECAKLVGFLAKEGRSWVVQDSHFTLEWGSETKGGTFCIEGYQVYTNKAKAEMDKLLKIWDFSKVRLTGHELERAINTLT